MRREPAGIALLRADYQALLDDADPILQDVAREQLERLERGRQVRRRCVRRRTNPDPDARGAAEPRRWAFALRELLADDGNVPVRWRSDDVFDTTHNGSHVSRSGTCLQVDTRLGAWWCSSCRRGGDAIGWVRQHGGVTFTAAYAALLMRFGPPFCAPTEVH